MMRYSDRLGLLLTGVLLGSIIVWLGALGGVTFLRLLAP
jgi:hypothetical protein